MQKPLGKFIDHRLFGEANPRVSDPLIVIEGDVAYLLVAIGKRLSQRFALATASVRDLERVLAGQG